MTLPNTVPAPSGASSKAAGKTSASAAVARAGWVAHAIGICLLAYQASAWLVEASGMLLHRLGMAQADAVMAASMAGFVYLWAMALWAFSRHGAMRAWLCMAGLAGLAFLATWMMGAAA
ncbi:MAG: hypothetical protein QM740_01060 [Acidovorax sp.]